MNNIARRRLENQHLVSPTLTEAVDVVGFEPPTPSSLPFFVGLPQCSSWRSLAVVLVMAAPPEPRLVAPLGRTVEPLVHAPGAAHSPLVPGVGVVNHPILQPERAHTWPSLPVRRPVCSNARSDLGDEGIMLAVHGQSKVPHAAAVVQ